LLSALAVLLLVFPPNISNVFLSSDISRNYTRNFTCYAGSERTASSWGRANEEKSSCRRFMSAASPTSDIKFDNRRDSAHETYEQFFLPPRECRVRVARRCVAAYFPPLQQRNRSSDSGLRRRFLARRNSGEARGKTQKRCGGAYFLHTFAYMLLMLASLSSFRTQMQKKEKLRGRKGKALGSEPKKKGKRIRRRAGGREGSAEPCCGARARGDEVYARRAGQAIMSPAPKAPELRQIA
jgi:hypothetical protein